MPTKGISASESMLRDMVVEECDVAFELNYRCNVSGCRTGTQSAVGIDFLLPTAGGGENVVSDCQGAWWHVESDLNVVSDCVGILDATGGRNTFNNFFGARDLGFTGTMVSVAGSDNRFFSASVQGADTTGSPVVSIGSGDRNHFHGYVEYGGSGDYILEVGGAATETRLDFTARDLQDLSLGRASISGGTCIPRVTKEWGKSGIVVPGQALLLEAWDDLTIIQCVATWGTAGDAVTNISIEVNGATVGSIEILAGIERGTVDLSENLHAGDLVNFEVVDAGGTATDLSLQVRMV